jgi:hypothetical protein
MTDSAGVQDPIWAFGAEVSMRSFRRDHRFGVRPRAFMHSLKACARLPALADIAAWRSHS